MIRAHLATFPPRRGILMETVASILPQVDRLFICLNGFDAVPPELGDQDRIEAFIPPQDLKDAGKFAFPPAPDDIVFTIDDDILYPPDYVTRTVAVFDRLDPARNVLGFHGNAWVFKDQAQGWGWRNFLFHRQARQIVKVDVLGTGTACQIGRLLPGLDDMRSAAGFVDLRHAWLHNAAGRDMWILPRAEGELVNNMQEGLQSGSLFRKVHLARGPEMLAEHRRMMDARTPLSGLKLEKVRKIRATESPADPTA